MTPYYLPGKISDIIDPTDNHPLVNIKKSLFEVNLKGCNVLSISTIEHIGTGDYGLTTAEKCTIALDIIIEDSLTCLVTVPIGYNKILDDYIVQLKPRADLYIDLYYRSKDDNVWLHTQNIPMANNIEYGPLMANGLFILRKGAMPAMNQENTMNYEL